ncbi:MAG: Cof-type HAD-IIB family hydrolase [Rikenellaceae bacterium]
MTNSFKMVVLDLDGTLTNSKKELSERNRSTLIKLQEQGVKVVLASGRPTYGIVPIAKALELERFGGYILAYNGGVIINCATKEEVYSNVLPDDLIAPLHKYSVEEGCVILSYDNEFILTEQPENRYVGVEAHLNKMEVRRVDDFVTAFSAPLPKCLSVGEPERILALEQRLKGLFSERMGIFRSEPFFLELVPLGIDKAFSLSRLLEYTGGTKEEMIAFGDGFNDLSMIEFAGVGVAMANAQDTVKERADYIAQTNDEDGVALYIEQFLLK